jgi:hypothetical protein
MNSMMLTSFDQLQSCRVYMSSMMLTSFNYLQSCTAAQLYSFMKCEVTFLSGSSGGFTMKCLPVNSPTVNPIYQAVGHSGRQ